MVEFTDDFTETEEVKLNKKSVKENKKFERYMKK